MACWPSLRTPQRSTWWTRCDLQSRRVIVYRAAERLRFSHARARTQNKNVPLLWLHGDADDVIPSAQGKRSFDALVASGLTGATWKGYSRLGHSIDQRTIRDVDEFLERVGAAADKK